MYSNSFETALAVIAFDVYTCVHAVPKHHSGFKTATSVSLLNVASSAKIYRQELRLSLHCLYPADLQLLALFKHCSRFASVFFDSFVHLRSSWKRRYSVILFNTYIYIYMGDASRGFKLVSYMHYYMRLNWQAKIIFYLKQELSNLNAGIFILPSDMFQKYIPQK